MLEAVFALARPLLNALDPEQAHELTLRSLEAGIYPRSSGAGRRPAGGERVGAGVPQSARHRRGLRQGRARGGGRARHGARLCRDRHRHAATTAGQSAPARLPAGRGPRDSSTGSASTTAATPRRWRGCERRPPRGIVGINVGANKDAPDRAADYVEGIRASTTSPATSPSTSPRPTRRACATCRPRRRSMICWRACWRRDRN